MRLTCIWVKEGQRGDWRRRARYGPSAFDQSNSGQTWSKSGLLRLTGELMPACRKLWSKKGGQMAVKPWPNAGQAVTIGPPPGAGRKPEHRWGLGRVGCGSEAGRNGLKTASQKVVKTASRRRHRRSSRRQGGGPALAAEGRIAGGSPVKSSSGQIVRSVKSSSGQIWRSVKSCGRSSLAVKSSGQILWSNPLVKSSGQATPARRRPPPSRPQLPGTGGRGR